MKLTGFEIRFDNQQGVFSAGTPVSGTLLISLAKPMKMRSLKIVFVGEGKTHWTKHSGDSSTVHYRGSESYINSFIKLFESESQTGSRDHPAGTHAYPFALHLPDTLPSSFEGVRGHVRYFCKATIDRPWKFDSHIKRAFTVIHQLDLNQVPEAPIPINGWVRQEIEGCCCSAGTVEVSISLNKTGYVPGEPVVYDILVDNRSDYSINNVELELIQTTTYQGRSDKILSMGHRKLHPKTASFSLLLHNCDIKKNTSEAINRATLIPSLPPSKLEGCAIIDIDYNVQLKVQCKSTRLKITQGIIIGTIPLHQPTFQPPFTPSAPDLQGSSPVITQPQSVNLDITSDPVPPSYEEALAPPPSYSECVYGRTTIKDDDDDDNTAGDVTWAPAYPYYDWSTLPYRGRRPEVDAAGPPKYDDE